MVGAVTRAQVKPPRIVIVGSGGRLGAALQRIYSGVYEVTGFNRHDHLLTMRDSTGKSLSFHVGPKTVVESAFGVVDGSRFNAQKGEQVRVTAGFANGKEDALFIRPL